MSNMNKISRRMKVNRNSKLWNLKNRFSIWKKSLRNRDLVRKLRLGCSKRMLRVVSRRLLLGWKDLSSLRFSRIMIIIINRLWGWLFLNLICFNLAKKLLMLHRIWDALSVKEYFRLLIFMIILLWSKSV